MNFSATAEPATAKIPYAWYGTFMLFLTMLLAYMDRLVMGFLLEPIRIEFSLSDSQMGMVSGFAFAVTYVLMGIPLGRMIDKYNRVRVLAVCMILWSVMTCLSGFTAGFISLFLIRIGVGIGEAAVHPAYVSLVSDYFRPEKVATPIALVSLGSALGSGLAIVLGGALLSFYDGLQPITLAGLDGISSWRFVFLSIGAPGIALAFILYITLPDPGRRSGSIKHPGGGDANMGDIAAHFRKHLALYVLTFGGFILHGFYSYGWHTFSPAMLARNYGATANDIGAYYGIGYVVCSIAGILFVGPFVEWMESRGASDAPITAALSLLAVMMLPAIAGPLMPAFAASVICLWLTVFCYSAILCISAVALVRITPGDIRGLTMGAYVSVMNLTGGAFGALLVGLLSDHVFGQEKLGYALATEGLLTLPLAFIMLAKARPHFRRMVNSGLV